MAASTTDEYDRIDSDALLLVGDAHMDHTGLVGHHLDSFNEAMTTGIGQIIQDVFQIDRTVQNEIPGNEGIGKIRFQVTFENVTMLKPTVSNYKTGKEEVLYPLMALQNGQTYASAVHVDINVKTTAYKTNGEEILRTDKVLGHPLCKVPTMVGSKLCNTYGLSREALRELHEDPYHPGGYFIIMGVEWVIICGESVLYNSPRMFNNMGYGKEICRCELISKPGDGYLNSDQIIVRLLNNGQLTIEIVRDKLKDVQFPFFVLFRMLGWSTDKEIYDNIVLDYDSVHASYIIKKLRTAYDVVYEQFPDAEHVHEHHETMEYVIRSLESTVFSTYNLEKEPDNYQNAYNYLNDRALNEWFLPHMGKYDTHRHQKARYLAMMIRNLFLVNMGQLEETDRDSYLTKRVFPAGVMFLRSFKTFFNASIIQNIQRRLLNEFKRVPFAKVNLGALIRASVFGAELETLVARIFTSSQATLPVGPGRVITNRLSTQILNRKNQMATIDTLRQIATPSNATESKASQRARDLRQVHASTLSGVCPITASTGPKVGVNKQMTAFAIILGASSSALLEAQLLEDPDVLALDSVIWEDIGRHKLSPIYINGKWVGVTSDSIGLAHKYRKLRRELKLDSIYTTIHWNESQDTLNFWCDMGRVAYPLMVVYNNRRDPEKFTERERKSTRFIQRLGFTSKHIGLLYAKKLSIMDLVRMQLVEYITSAEQFNCYAAANHQLLREHKHDEFKPYTHCYMPQAMLSFTALSMPYAQHTAITRAIYNTNQIKQACGYPSRNWPYRRDKETFVQFVNETPMVDTYSSKYIDPTGNNVYVVVMTGGFNQEDGLIANRGAFHRGVFNGQKMTFMESRASLAQREMFKTPDPEITTDIKSANYGKLIDGVVPTGIYVEKNDVLIGKTFQMPQAAHPDGKKEVDRSTVFQKDEKAIVHNVLTGRNHAGEEFYTVVLKLLRNGDVGDKFCKLPSSQVLTNRGWINLKHVDIERHRVATLVNGTTLQYVKPIAKHIFHHEGEMYRFQNEHVHEICTPNHRLYVKRSGAARFNLVPARHMHGQELVFKKNAANNYPDKKYHLVREHLYPVDVFLPVLALFLTNGHLHHHEVHLRTSSVAILNRLHYVREGIKIPVEYVTDGSTCILQRKHLYNEFKSLHGMLPSWVFSLSCRQSKILLQALLTKGGRVRVEKLCLADDITKLAFHCGWSAQIVQQERSFDVLVEPKNNEPYVDVQACSTFQYNGAVMCLELPQHHVFYSRETPHDPPCWTGNSSRFGQKGVLATMLPDSDMPFLNTEHGTIKPTLIINPHAFPSRQTVGQLIESAMGLLGAHKGCQYNGTAFNSVNMTSLSKELESYGLQPHGYHKMYSGATGECMDSMLFVGPVFYQRLQKFVIEQKYTVSHGPSDAITRQPLPGKANNGGLRIGEMERDVLIAHGVGTFLHQKFFDHSDGYEWYFCRCGRDASVVNTDRKIFKCQYCQDNTDIVIVKTSWSSMIFMRELISIGVNVTKVMQPFEYEISAESHEHAA